MVGKPHETVRKITSMPRWQRNWINSHRSVNYSGLVQETLSKIIEKHDPEYFKKYKEQIKPSRRAETTLAILA